MICNCLHSKVCRYKSDIETAFSGVLEMYFGGRGPEQPKLDKLIQEVCTHRIANDVKEESK